MFNNNYDLLQKGDLILVDEKNTGFSNKKQRPYIVQENYIYEEYVIAKPKSSSMLKKEETPFETSGIVDEEIVIWYSEILHKIE